MTTTTVKKENGRDRLIASSLKLFSEKGYHACSIREICDLAKANISLVSFHFGGKEGLLDVIFQELKADKFEAIEGHLTEPSSRDELKNRLNLFLESYVDYYLSQPDVISLYLEELERGHEQAHGRLPETFGKIWHSLVQYLKDAQEKQYIQSAIDTKMLAYQIISPVTHLMRSRKSAYVNSLFTLNDENFRRQFIRQLVDTVPA